MKTKDKIIQASLELFNEQGERNVTTNHIAAHMGISPGNLYYHFRNKDDIIRSIFHCYEQNLERMFPDSDPKELGLDDLLPTVDRLFDSMWTFRFFYANLPDILARDPELQQRYLVAQNQLSQRLVAILRAMRDQEILDIEDENLVDLAHTLKLVATFWISYKLTQSQEAITQGTVYEGVVKVLCIFKGHLTPQGHAYFDAVEQKYRSLATQPAE